MENYQRSFIEFAIQRQALRFGDFTLKSGRQSPYFFNIGLFNTGTAIKRLGEFYAATIVNNQLEMDVIFGPAYKGIPLVIATSISLNSNHNLDVPYAFNRKEAKDHGEGGNLVGSPLSGQVLIIDDVITAGTAIREIIPMINRAGGIPSGIIIALDRCEKGESGLSTCQELEQALGVAVTSIVTIHDIVSYLHHQPTTDEQCKIIENYLSIYGVKK